MNGIIFTLNPQNYSITNLKQQRANRNQEAISLQKMVDDMFAEGALGEEEQNQRNESKLQQWVEKHPPPTIPGNQEAFDSHRLYPCLLVPVQKGACAR